MYKRLRDKQSSYELNKLLKDYYKNQYYKQNACRYPSIDFFKENKNLSMGPKSLKQHNNNFKTCKTENNYFPKISKTITSNFKSSSNYINDKLYTCEGFKTLGNKKNKGKKKKFKDFNFKD